MTATQWPIFHPAEEPARRGGRWLAEIAGPCEFQPLSGRYSRPTKLHEREKVTPMPYSKISDLPDKQVDQYSHHQKEAFLEAFNSAFEQYDGDEGRAFATAHAAAQRTPKEDPTPGD
jgi:cation transport regulator